MIYFNKALKTYGNSEGSLNAYNAIGKLYTDKEIMTWHCKTLKRHWH